MTTKIYENIYAFLDREDKYTNGVSPRFAEKHPDYKRQNLAKSECWSCLKRNGETSGPLKIPVIKDIHREVFKAVSQDIHFSMDDWHHCKSSHCRGGWVVHLAGKDGYALEEVYGPELAAKIIYKASGYYIENYCFYQPKALALMDMERLANDLG